LAQTRGWLAQAPSVDALIAGSQRVNSGAIQPAMNLSEVEAQDLSSPVYLYADDNGRAQDPARAFADGAEFAYFVTARDILGRDGLPSPAGLATACRTLGPAIPSGLKVSNQHAFTDKEAGDDSQWLRVEWIPNPGGQRAVPTRYEIFRGLDLSELEAADGPPLAHRVASVPHAATGSLSYDDRSLAPKENFYGRTFWYAGRAVYEGPCGAIYSPLSPPIFGSLRKATAPPAPSGSVEGNCPFPMAAWSVNRLSDAESVANDGQVHFRAECHRRGPGVLWAEFSVFLPRSKREIRLDRVFFPADLDVVSAVYTLSPQEADTPFQLSCAVASAEGAASNAADRPVASILRPPAGRLTIDRFEAAELTTWDLRPDDPLTAPLLSGQVCFSPVSARDDGAVLIQSPQLGNGLAVLFAVEQGHSPRALGTFRADAGSIALTDAEVNARNADNLPWQYCGYLVSPNLAGLSDCPHLARADGGSRVHHPHVRVRLTPDARQYRIFRRVDAGPLELIAQGRVDGSQTPSITRDDDAQPPRGAQICYYAQLLDANGNVSPMSLLGCLTHTADLPTPVLASPETDGDYADPRVKLQWFCDPAGVERFEVFLVSVAGKVDLDQLLVETSGTLIPWPPAPSSIFNARALHTVKDVKSGDSSSAAAEQSFLTGKVGGDFGEGPQFTLNLRIQPTKTYDVWVKAVGPTGRRGGQSYKQRFVWRPPPPPRSKAPWPARPLPPRVEFHPGIAAASHLSCQSDADAPQVGVRIGAMPLSADASCGNGRPGPVILAKAPATDVGLSDPNRWVFTDSASSPPRTNVTLLPAILYREQIPNAAFPRVKGDLAQVSPLVQKIAWNPIPFARDASIASLVDPFIGVKANPNFGLFNLPSALELFILDTHPLLSGAKYRYWLLHYGPNGEPESTIPAGEIQIP
ncbi:MAG: hypothetical protein HYR88_02430, partial [Verrucomicrobia bacterium]|nr:hypothetical protein [Verrucomicrobiota bacterium]